MKSINQIINKCLQMSTAHPQVNGFGYGPLYDIVGQEINYPYLWVVNEDSHTLSYSENNHQYNTLDYTFVLRVADKVNDQPNVYNANGENSNNGLEVVSDTAQILTDMINSIAQDSLAIFTDIEILDDVDIEPFFHEDSGDVNGHQATITLRVPNESQCVTPLTPTGVFDPVASYTYLPAAPEVDEIITFTNTSTGTEPLTYLWDFGDTNTSTDENPTYSYSATGSYTVCLTTTNIYDSDSYCEEITILPGATQSAACNSPYFALYGEIEVNLNLSDGLYYWYFTYKSGMPGYGDIISLFVAIYGSYVGPLSIDMIASAGKPTGFPGFKNLSLNAVVGEQYLLATTTTTSNFTIDLAYTDLGLANSEIGPSTVIDGC